MFAYFRYLSKVIFSKIPLWLIVGIGYIFAIVFLIVVPAFTKTSPILMWNFDLINIQTTFITIEAVKSALLVGYAFKNDVEDGSELIIYSKPLKRIKILLPKLIWVILANLLFSVGYIIIALCTMAFGQYDAISHPAGMQYNKILALVASLIIGPFVVNLIFSSFAVFIGNFGNKLKIFITVTLVAIILSIYDVIGSVVMSDKSSKIVSKYDGEITSFSVKSNGLDYKNFAFYDTLPKIDLYDVDRANNDFNNYIYQTLNINNQLSNFYKLFDLDDVKTTLESSEYGQYPKFRTTIKSKDDNLLNFLESCYHTNNQLSYPFIIPISNDLYTESKEPGEQYNYKTLGFMSLGLDSSIRSWLKYLGADPHDIWLSNLTMVFDVVPSTYVSDKDLMKIWGDINEFDKNVFENITLKILNDEDKNYNFKSIFNVYSKQEDAKEIQTKFDELCYKFINDNKEKYNIWTNTLTNTNLSMAKIQYSMLKHFCMIYWTQIIQQLVKDYDITNYLKNDDLTNYAFQNSFKEIVEIKNPYDLSAEPIKISVDSFTRCFLAYTGVGQINSRWNGWTLKTFGYSCLGINEEGKPLFNEEIPEGPERYYFMFPSQYISVYNQQGYDIASVYHYTTTEFYTRASTIIFWSIVSFIWFAGSMIGYLRNDVS